MSEVKRYLIQKTPIGTMMKPNPEGNWIAGEDFNRVTAERDGLQTSLNTTDQSIDELNAAISRRTHRVRELEALLTAADERADVLEGLLREVEAACDLAMSAIDHDERGANFVRIIAAIKAKAVPKRSDELVAQHAAIDFFDAALKPAEGGGDGVAHDRAFRNGLMQGYNLALNGSEKEYQDAVARYSVGKNAE